MPLSVAFLRVAFSCSFLISELYRTDFKPILAFGHSTYYPKGIAGLIFSAPPTLHFVNILQIIAMCMTVLWMFGILARASGILSFFSNLLLVSLYYSFRPTESHEYNVMLLGQFLVTLSPCATALSLMKQKEATPWITVIVCWCAQLIVAWMFVNAFLYKTLLGGFFPWALSDNMRNIIGFQQIRLARPMPDWILWASQHHVVYSTMAFANLICQAGTFLGVLFFNRPYLRLVSALAFIFEVLGLGFVMGRWDISPWNPHWLMLTAVFIDWDYFFSKGFVPLPKLEIRLGSALPLVVTAFEIFVSLFGIRLPVHALYPFTHFPMYSQVYAKTPHSEHQTYEFFGPYVGESYTTNRKVLLFENSVHVIDDLKHLENEALRLCSKANLDDMVFEMAYYSVPKYPEKAVPGVLLKGVRAVVNDGTFRGIACNLFTNRIELESKNLAEEPDFKFYIRQIEYSYYAPIGVRTASIKALGEKKPLAGELKENTYTLTNLVLDPKSTYLLVVEANLPDGTRTKFWNPIGRPD